MSSTDTIHEDLHDGIISTLLTQQFPNPNEQYCKSCKFYKLGTCKKDALNALGPFFKINACYEKMSLKEKLIVLLASTHIIVS